MQLAGAEALHHRAERRHGLQHGAAQHPGDPGPEGGQHQQGSRQQLATGSTPRDEAGFVGREVQQQHTVDRMRRGLAMTTDAGGLVAHRMDHTQSVTGSAPQPGEARVRHRTAATVEAQALEQRGTVLTAALAGRCEAHFAGGGQQFGGLYARQRAQLGNQTRKTVQIPLQHRIVQAGLEQRDHPQ